MWSTPGPLRFSLHGNTGRGQTHVWVPAGASRRVRIWGERRLSGYVSLRVPAGRTPGRFALAPQLRGSVRVLLHASHETYRPSRRQPLIHSDGVTEDLSYTIGDDKSSASIALASGRAENEIEAEGWSVGGISDFLNALSDGVLTTDELRGGRDVPEDQRQAALLDLLSGLEAGPEDLEKMNQLLTESGASVRLESS